MKIKTLLIVGLLFSAANIFAQIPTGYYDGTVGLSGAALKTKLSQIITNGHQTKSYDNLYVGYPTTDRDNYYENDGSVLDMYSENPSGTDPYVYQHGIKKCGNYSTEGDCYNREHIVPQSFFGSASPMVSDIHHIPPTDGKVNGMRSNNPFGVVTSPTFTSQNGSKLGKNTTAGYSGVVFEPIDAFKGDIARMVFYFVTRYESKLSSFSTGNMLGGSAYPGLQDWELQVLLAWNAADPVSQREIDRNNAAYAYQGNRNPFIDNSNFVNLVWGGSAPSSDTTPPSQPTNLTVTGSTSSTVSLSWTASTDDIGVNVYEIYVDGIFYGTVSGSSTTAIVNGLTPSTTYDFYLVARDAAGNLSAQSPTVAATTIAGSGGTPTTCGTENFSGTPNKASTSYVTNSWTNNGITWTATDSRTDNEIYIFTGNPALLLRNGSLTSSTISGGIGSLTVTTKWMYTTGADGTFNLMINGEMVGTIPFKNTPTTTTIPNINISGPITISITDNSTSGNSKVTRVSFDDLSWTCYTTPLSTTEVETPKLSIYPNPVKNNTLYVTGKNIAKIKRLEIYNVNGILVQVADKPFNNKNYLVLKNLPKGIYFAKFDDNAQKFLVE
jgi:endonuclease I/chitodextrinase